jgi:hypothetical protein
MKEHHKRLFDVNALNIGAYYFSRGNSLLSFISRYKSLNLEMKESYVPYTFNILKNVDYVIVFLMCGQMNFNLKIVIFQIIEHQQLVIDEYIL